MTRGDWEILREQQGGLCAICRQVPPTDVDHDHNTGGVRGLLCHLCNVGVGWFRNDPERMEAAARYIREARQ